MKRRLVQHGYSSLTVTLPNKWIKQLNLKKGDEVDVSQQDKDLIVSVEQKEESQKKTFDVTESGIFTKNNLTHLYLLGYDEMEIRFKDEKTLSEIKKRVPECIGYEIIDQKPNRVYIKSIATALETDFDLMLRKGFLITSEMGKEMLEAVRKQDYEKLTELRHLESINNRFTMCCARILNKKGHAKYKRTLPAYDLVKQLERIADEYKYICDLLKNYNARVPKHILDFFAKINDYYYGFYQLFYKFRPELKKDIYENRIKLLQEGKEIIIKTKGKESMLIHYLMNVLSKTYDAAGAYFAFML
jgi:phosphate uptake regulator